MTTIGQLRDRIEILTHSQAVDEWGTPLPGTSQWLPIAAGAVWANVRHLSGIAAIKADADTSVVKTSIRIRRRKDIDASMRVRFDGRIYQIDAILPDQLREFCDLACKLVT